MSEVSEEAERNHKVRMEHEGEESYRVSMRDTIILYDILVTGIELPAAIVAAINRKTEQYYIAEEYKFRVEREKRELERKKIEAEGIRDFQQTVSQGISESYHRLRLEDFQCVQYSRSQMIERGKH
jgi:prohibitin 2